MQSRPRPSTAIRGSCRCSWTARDLQELQPPTSPPGCSPCWCLESLSNVVLSEPATSLREPHRLRKSAPPATRSTSTPPHAPATRPMLSELPYEFEARSGSDTGRACETARTLTDCIRDGNRRDCVDPV
eukprot:1147469-Rhodomonas_salina.1